MCSDFLRTFDSYITRMGEQMDADCGDCDTLHRFNCARRALRFDVASMLGFASLLLCRDDIEATTYYGYG